jgi:quinoprotein glucose dehydrogenase
LDVGLLYLPTGSPSPDFYGGLRPGEDRDADSVVALDAKTGRKVWAFQVVHHNLWDYDVAAQPVLFEYQNHIPAVAIGTKMGMIFVLNRLTGAPIYPVEERPVPQSDVPGEKTSSTQPFSTLPSLAPLSLQAGDLAGHTLADASVCASRIAALRNDGIYTPPSLRGSLLYPGSLGGVNWGSPGFDPETGILYVNSNHHAFRTKLVPRWRFETDEVLGSWENWIYASLSLLGLSLLLRRKLYPGWVSGGAVLILSGCGVVVAVRPAERQHFGTETAPQRKAPYAVERAPITDEHGLPCTPMPWGKMSALNLNTGKIEWERPLGTMITGAETGSLNLGGPIVTRGGLVITAAVREPVLRAFDKRTGSLVWTGKLPVPAQSTPMTYELDGKQYVVVAAGGHGGFGTPQGDSLIAFALQ